MASGSESEEEIFFGPTITEKEMLKVCRYGHRKTIFVPRDQRGLPLSGRVSPPENAEGGDSNDSCQNASAMMSKQDSSEDECFFGPVTEKEMVKVRRYGRRKTIFIPIRFRESKDDGNGCKPLSSGNDVSPHQSPDAAVTKHAEMSVLSSEENGNDICAPDMITDTSVEDATQQTSGSDTGSWVTVSSSSLFTVSSEHSTEISSTDACHESGDATDEGSVYFRTDLDSLSGVDEVYQSPTKGVTAEALVDKVDDVVFYEDLPGGSAPEIQDLVASDVSHNICSNNLTELLTDADATKHEMSLLASETTQKGLCASDELSAVDTSLDDRVSEVVIVGDSSLSALSSDEQSSSSASIEGQNNESLSSDGSVGHGRVQKEESILLVDLDCSLDGVCGSDEEEEDVAFQDLHGGGGVDAADVEDGKQSVSTDYKEFESSNIQNSVMVCDGSILSEDVTKDELGTASELTENVQDFRQTSEAYPTNASNDTEEVDSGDELCGSLDQVALEGPVDKEDDVAPELEDGEQNVSIQSDADFEEFKLPCNQSWVMIHEDSILSLEDAAKGAESFSEPGTASEWTENIPVIIELCANNECITEEVSPVDTSLGSSDGKDNSIFVKANLNSLSGDGVDRHPPEVISEGSVDEEEDANDEQNIFTESESGVFKLPCNQSEVMIHEGSILSLEDATEDQLFTDPCNATELAESVQHNLVNIEVHPMDVSTDTKDGHGFFGSPEQVAFEEPEDNEDSVAPEMEDDVTAEQNVSTESDADSEEFKLPCNQSGVIVCGDSILSEDQSFSEHDNASELTENVQYNRQTIEAYPVDASNDTREDNEVFEFPEQVISAGPIDKDEVASELENGEESVSIKSESEEFKLLPCNQSDVMIHSEGSILSLEGATKHQSFFEPGTATELTENIPVITELCASNEHITEEVYPVDTSVGSILSIEDATEDQLFTDPCNDTELAESVQDNMEKTEVYPMDVSTDTKDGHEFFGSPEQVALEEPEDNEDSVAPEMEDDVTAEQNVSTESDADSEEFKLPCNQSGVIVCGDSILSEDQSFSEHDNASELTENVQYNRQTIEAYPVDASNDTREDNEVFEFPEQVISAGPIDKDEVASELENGEESVSIKYESEEFKLLPCNQSDVMIHSEGSILSLEGATKHESFFEPGTATEMTENIPVIIELCASNEHITEEVYPVDTSEGPILSLEDAIEDRIFTDPCNDTELAKSHQDDLEKTEVYPMDVSTDTKDGHEVFGSPERVALEEPEDNEDSVLPELEDDVTGEQNVSAESDDDSEELKLPYNLSDGKDNSTFGKTDLDSLSGDGVCRYPQDVISEGCVDEEEDANEEQSVSTESEEYRLPNIQNSFMMNDGSILLEDAAKDQSFSESHTELSTSAPAIKEFCTNYRQTKEIYPIIASHGSDDAKEDSGDDVFVGSSERVIEEESVEEEEEDANGEQSVSTESDAEDTQSSLKVHDGTRASELCECIPGDLGDLQVSPTDASRGSSDAKEASGDEVFGSPEGVTLEESAHKEENDTTGDQSISTGSDAESEELQLPHAQSPVMLHNGTRDKSSSETGIALELPETIPGDNSELQIFSTDASHESDDDKEASGDEVFEPPEGITAEELVDEEEENANGEQSASNELDAEDTQSSAMMHEGKRASELSESILGDLQVSAMDATRGSRDAKEAIGGEVFGSAEGVTLEESISKDDDDAPLLTTGELTSIGESDTNSREIALPNIQDAPGTSKLCDGFVHRPIIESVSDNVLVVDDDLEASGPVLTTDSKPATQERAGTPLKEDSPSDSSSSLINVDGEISFYGFNKPDSGSSGYMASVSSDGKASGSPPGIGAYDESLLEEVTLHSLLAEADDMVFGEDRSVLVDLTGYDQEDVVLLESVSDGNGMSDLPRELDENPCAAPENEQVVVDSSSSCELGLNSSATKDTRSSDDFECHLQSCEPELLPLPESTRSPVVDVCLCDFSEHVLSGEGAEDKAEADRGMCDARDFQELCNTSPSASASESQDSDETKRIVPTASKIPGDSDKDTILDIVGSPPSQCREAPDFSEMVQASTESEDVMDKDAEPSHEVEYHYDALGSLDLVNISPVPSRAADEQQVPVTPVLDTIQEEAEPEKDAGLPAVSKKGVSSTPSRPKGTKLMASGKDEAKENADPKKLARKPPTSSTPHQLTAAKQTHLRFPKPLTPIPIAKRPPFISYQQKDTKAPGPKQVTTSSPQVHSIPRRRSLLPSPSYSKGMLAATSKIQPPKKYNVTSPVARYIRERPAPPLIRNVWKKTHMANTHEMSVILGRDNSSSQDSHPPAVSAQQLKEGAVGGHHPVDSAATELRPAKYMLRGRATSSVAVNNAAACQRNLYPSPRIIRHKGASKTLQWATHLELDSPEILSSPSSVPSQANRSILRTSSIDQSVLEEVPLKTSHTLLAKTKF